MQDTKEKAVLSQGRSLSRKYLRWNRSHAGKKSGGGEASVSGRRNGICEGPKAGLRAWSLPDSTGRLAWTEPGVGRWQETEQETRAGPPGPG